jgi:RNA polymerase sigma-70 factor (ECF subfamily)
MNDLEAFYRGNARLVYALALGQTGNPADAEDLTQETFLRAWRHFRVLASLAPAAQRAWLIRTMRHLAIDTWRRTRQCSVLGARCSVEDMEEADAELHGVFPSEHRAPSTEHLALRADVAQALATLTPEDREIVTLRYFMEMNSREIGETLQMPEGTVRHRLMQCRQVLAERLAAWRPGGDIG